MPRYVDCSSGGDKEKHFVGKPPKGCQHPDQVIVNEGVTFNVRVSCLPSHSFKNRKTNWFIVFLVYWLSGDQKLDENAGFHDALTSGQVCVDYVYVTSVKCFT